MCPPGPSPPSDIGPYWTDEELIVSLHKIQHGSPLPSNVLVDVNPFDYEPSDIPNDVWYFIRSEDKRDTQAGFWKAKGEGCQIYTDSEFTGWRTTLEFYEGKSHNGCKTVWVMQNYWITQKGSDNSKVSGSLCRVFSCDGGCKRQKLEDNSHNYQIAPADVVQVNARHDETKSSHPEENQDDLDCFSRGDYLELLDLVNPRSSSSSSDNSSCLSRASDEVFDYLALLNDLEPENNKESQSTSTSYKFSLSASSIPNEVVVPPATSGSLISIDGSRPGVEPLQDEHPLAGPSSKRELGEKDASKCAAQTQMELKAPSPRSNEASSSQRSAPDKGKKIDCGKMKMLRKKYFCFMPF